MMKKQNPTFAKIRRFLVQYQKVLFAAAITGLVPLVYWLVYATGGIKYVYSHSMYLAITLAGIMVHPLFGAFIGIFGGLMLGPLMPFETVSMEPQAPLNWIFRMIIFTFIGVLSGYGARRIASLEMHNQDTGLHNTNYLKRGAKQLKNQSHAIMTLLINNYHDILDVLGVDVYYDLIRLIERQIRDEISRPFLIIQVDNNRFWIIQPLTELAYDVERVIKALKTIHTIRGEPVYIEYSLGAHETDKREDCEKMATFIYSDSAARIATENRIPYVIYQDEMSMKRKQYELLMHVQNSFEQQDFFLVFQPQIRFKDGVIEGLEALIRWKHPTRGIIPPSDFIPLVEKTRLIGELTMYVFRHTIQAIKHLSSAGYRIPISVNVSAKNLFDPLFFEKTFELLTVHEIDPALVRIEVTESTVMDNPEVSAEVLKKFADHGVQIIIDDFGTGYSSLSYLSRYPVSTIKIDRYFIKNIHQNSSIHKIVSATVKLAHDLGYEVLAEGVETDTIKQTVIADEFDSAQGYLFAKPLDIDKLIDYLKQQKENPTA